MDFSIRELESLSGIKAHTIRIWEQRYHFLKPSRTETNIRRYSNEELKTLLTVALLNRYGYKISRIDEMGHEQRKAAVLELDDTEAFYAHQVNEMLGCMIDLKGWEFEQLLDSHISKFGLDQTINEIIFLFLEKVGLLWQTSKILPVQEHLVSNIIRQKIIRGIENLSRTSRSAPSFLLFLPEGEHHEMGLLFVNYLLRKQGLDVIYLGANVPVSDISYVCSIRKPAFIYLHLTSFPRQQNFQKFLGKLKSSAGNSKILISGSSLASQKKDIPAGIKFFTSMDAVVSFITGLS